MTWQSIAFVVATLTLVVPWPAAAADNIYADPDGHYRLLAPSGWKVNAQKQGVSLIRGQAYASLMHVRGEGEPKGLVEAMAQRITSQWQGFDGANSGDCRFAGQPGFCAWYTGTNPRGVAAVLKMAGTTGSGHGYVLFMSAPRKEFAAHKSEFERIQSSFEILRRD